MPDVLPAAAEMRLALGTVQFGLAYGVAGRGEPVPEAEVRAILEDAASRGVRLLDTAAAYGDIEERLGRLAQGLPLSVVSKVPALPDGLPPAEAAAFALAAARRTRERLGGALCGLMLHRAQDLDGAVGEAVLDALRRWAHAEALPLGASCYGPDEAIALRQRHGIALAQVPGNALDQRLGDGATASALLGVDVHLRSAFLQGLLLMPAESAARRVPAAASALQRWQAWCGQHDLPALTAALAVVKSFRAVSTVVVGVDSLSQWQAIADAWQAATPCPASELAVDDSAVVDPRRWPKAS